MHAFEVVADPVRRRILELCGAGEVAAGGLVASIGREFGISQPATSAHLRVLRESGLATVRADGTRRFYAADRAALAELATWFDRFRDPFQQPLDALETELARGRRRARTAPPSPSEAVPPGAAAG